MTKPPCLAGTPCRETNSSAHGGTAHLAKIPFDPRPLLRHESCRKHQPMKTFRRFPLLVAVTGTLALAAGLAGCSRVEEEPNIHPPFKPGRSISELAVEAKDPPPAIAGGTLLVSADEKLIVAADPDRDAVWLVDSKTKKPAKVALKLHDEPGRIVEAGDDFFVVLRHAGEIARINRVTQTVTDRFAACAAPRGIAFAAASDSLKVACAGGEFLTLDAKSGELKSKKDLGADLRDVAFDGDLTLVSKYRTAEILVLDADGDLVRTLRPFVDEQHQSSLAWRMRENPAGGVVVSHQFSQLSEVDSEVEGGYGGFDCSSSIVTTAITTIQDGQIMGSLRVASTPLPVDVVPRDNDMVLAVAGALHDANANAVATGLESVSLFTLFDPSGGFENGEGNGASQAPPADFDGGGFGGFDAGSPGVGCEFPFPPDQEPTDGRQTVAVDAFADGTLVSQSRDPWMITIGQTDIDLPGETRKDSGHDLFHEDSGTGIACASCHGEGGDDGVAWRFSGLGLRRTPDLRGGILGTEPFHWDGEFKDLSTLMSDVFVGRMGGPQVPAPHMKAMTRWIDTMPEGPRVSGLDAKQIARGKHVFDSAGAQCATCHSGAGFTNNQTVNVGTGQSLQVPRLTGLGMRAPYMHNGCAKTLEERFLPGACGGGDEHGKVSQLESNDKADLIAYLKSL